MNIYLWVATIFITLIGMMWTNKTPANFIVKCGIFALAIWGWYVIFHLR